MSPSVQVRPAGMRKMRNIARKLVAGVGFSKGCALLALKKPPPLVPNCLMASCDATGPCAMVCVPAALEHLHDVVGLEVLDHSLRDEEQARPRRRREAESRAARAWCPPRNCRSCPARDGRCRG